jgi:DNA-binding PadR family transcriptional regulator
LPSSGYDLKRIFAATPMGIYQPSSGALYPALRRLELRGLVQAQAPSGQNGQSARHRRVYEPTQTGRAANRSWLGTPVEPATVSRDLGLHLMRFVLMEQLFPPEEVVAFLRSLAAHSRTSPRSWSGTRQRPIWATAIRALPSTMGWQCTGLVSDGPKTPSQRSALPPYPLIFIATDTMRKARDP